MSKFFLPSQKGTELFPDAIVAPPIIRWVGVDARAPEAQKILDQYGSALTSFYTQQAHNHSLSVNNQSRGYRQISSEIAVEYVNQFGKEFITMYVQTPTKKVEKKEEEKPPVVPGVCWFPDKSDGQLISDQYGLIEGFDPSYILDEESVLNYPGPGDAANNTDLGFTLKMWGKKFTNIGADLRGLVQLGLDFENYRAIVENFDDSRPPFYLNFSAPEDNWPENMGLDLWNSYRDTIMVYHELSSIEANGGFCSVRTGKTTFGTDERKFCCVRWHDIGYFDRYLGIVETEIVESLLYALNTDARCNFEIVIIEGVERAGRSPCPALIGLAYTNLDWEASRSMYGIDIGGGDYLYYNNGFDPLGIQAAGAGIFLAAPDGVRSTPAQGYLATNKGRLPGAFKPGVAARVSNKQFWFQVNGQGNVVPVHNFTFEPGETEHPKLCSPYPYPGPPYVPRFLPIPE